MALVLVGNGEDALMAQHSLKLREGCSHQRQRRGVYQGR